MTSLLVLASGKAGNADEANLDDAVRVLRSGAEVELAHSDSPEALDRHLDDRGDRPVIVAGGDGSLHTVVAALHRRGELARATVGLLPLGTGNDFARGLGLPLEAAAAARVVLAGHRRSVDLLVAEGPGDVVANAVHVGAGADAARLGAGWKKRLGRLGYPIGALLAALDPPVLHVDVEVDGRRIATSDRGVLQVAVGIGTRVGGGAPLLPDADPGDGLADVLVSFAVTPRARLGYAARMLLGHHPTHPEVTNARGRRVRIFGKDLWASADGELTGPHTALVWRLEAAAYDVFVPA